MSDRTADDLQSDLAHQLGTTDRIVRSSTEHIPVPSGHAPRLKAVVHPDSGGMIVAERDCDRDSGKWIQAENPVEVRQ